MTQSDNDLEIPYVTFELVEAKDVKEGKQGYKRTEKVMQDMPMGDFVKNLSLILMILPNM